MGPARAKKAAKPAAHPPYASMITAAIKGLKDKKGSSRQAILKYIVANNKVDAAKAGVARQARPEEDGRCQEGCGCRRCWQEGSRKLQAARQGAQGQEARCQEGQEAQGCQAKGRQEAGCQEG